MSLAKQLLFASVESEKIPALTVAAKWVDILVLDGRDERLKFLGLAGILTATCCPNCVGFLKGPALTALLWTAAQRYFPQNSLTVRKRWIAMCDWRTTKSSLKIPLYWVKHQYLCFYGSACEDVNTVGGFANWVQDAEYTTCPHCDKPMKYLAQIQWDTVMDGTEGTLYIEFCPECQIVSMQHQQT